MSDTAASDAATMLAGVERLVDRIRAVAPAMHEARRLDDDLVADLRGLGVFDMHLPAGLGGPGLTPMEQHAVIETLTLGDASVGWCVMIGCDSGYYPGFLDDATFRELYPERNLITAGKVAPNGKAVRHDDGWLVSGRWDFGSGSPHADRFVGGVFLHDTDGTPLSAEGGGPMFRAAFLPPDSVTVHDTWCTVGLRATGSNDYSVDEPVFVPDRWLWDPLGPSHPSRDEPAYRLPWLYLAKVAGVSTGLPRRALELAVSIAEGKFLMPDNVLLIDRPGTLEVLARQEAAARSARSFVLDEMARVWDACLHDGDLSRAATAPLRLAMVHASEVAAAVCRALVDLVTTSAIRADSVLAQVAADAVVANTHVATGPRSWVPLGARLTGREPHGGVYI